MSTIVAALIPTAIGLGGVLTSAAIARRTAVGIAELSAGQKQRDAELTTSKEYADALFAAERTSRVVTPDEWHEAATYLRPMQEAARRADYLAALISDPDVVRLHAEFIELATRIIQAPDNGVTAKDMWGIATATDKQPDLIARLIEAAHDLRARQLATYPTAAPGLLADWRSGLRSRIQAAVHPDEHPSE
jgi:hypothetical protein